jgi:lipoprotein-anchoring transpeptidase ErfK/SrfK
MALASQMPRGRGSFGPSRGPRGRSGRGGRGLWGWVLLALLAGSAGYWWHSYRGQVATTQPGTGISATPNGGGSGTETTAQASVDAAHSPDHAPPSQSQTAPTEHAHAVPPATGPTNGTTNGLSTTAGTAARLAEGMKLIEEGKMVQGRKALSRLLAAGVWEEPSPTTAPADGADSHAETLSADDAQSIRDTLTSINRTLIFSTKYIKDDPLTEFHTVVAGDILLKLAPPYSVPPSAIEVINNTPAKLIRIGQRLKMIHGPFHAVISEREYRMDLYIKDPGDGAMLYVRSFRVGLGESGSTPAGSWIIKRGGKITNPQWSNPKTGEFFPSGHPKSPIGKFWLALDGADEYTKTKKGFGIHGTDDPDTIGKQASMGCVHLADADIELFYKLMSEGLSTVLILP